MRFLIHDRDSKFTKYTTAERVVRIDGHTGKRSTVATLRPRLSDCVLLGMRPSSATYTHGSFFFIEPPVPVSGTRQLLYRLRAG